MSSYKNCCAIFIERGFAALEKEMRINLSKNSLVLAMWALFKTASQMTLNDPEARASYHPEIFRSALVPRGSSKPSEGIREALYKIL